MKRFARLLVVLSAAACGGTGVASAHVDYVTDGPAGSKSFAELLGGVAAAPLNLLLLAGGGAAAAGTAVAYLRYADRLTDVRVGIRTLRSYRPYLPWMLRLSMGLPLVGAGFAGYYFSPSVPVEARLLQVFVGFTLLFGLATRLVAAVGLAAYLVGLATHFPAMLLASEYVPGLLAIVALGPGQPDPGEQLPRRRRVADPAQGGPVGHRDAPQEHVRRRLTRPERDDGQQAGDVLAGQQHRREVCGQPDEVRDQSDGGDEPRRQPEQQREADEHLQ